MQTIIHFLVSAVAILITSYILPGVHVNGIFTAFVLAVVLGVINLTLRPVLVFLTLPLTIISLGVWVLFINALLVLLASYIVPGFTVNNFWWAFIFGIILAIVNWALQVFDREE